MINIKRSFVGLILFFLISNLAISQNKTEPIQTMNGLWPVFILDNEPLKPKQLLELMEDNPAAYKIMKAARRNYIIGNIIGGIGGFSNV